MFHVLVPMIITVVKEEHINVSGQTGDVLINSHTFQVLVFFFRNKLAYSSGNIVSTN